MSIKNYVFLNWGQSNSEGQGSDMSLSPSPTYDAYISEGGGEQRDVRYKRQTQCGNDYPAACGTETPWKRLECTAPIGNKTYNADIAMGRDLADAIGLGTTENARIWIICCATGSRDLADDWDPTGPNDYKLYARAKAFVEAAIAEIEANSDSVPGPVEIKGLLWAQGEADALNVGTATAYGTNFQAFLNQFWTDFGADIPVAVMQLGDNQVLAEKASVISGMQTVATNNPTKVYLIDMDGQPVNGSSPPHWGVSTGPDMDGYHYLGQQAASIFITHHGW